MTTLPTSLLAIAFNKNERRPRGEYSLTRGVISHRMGNMLSPQTAKDKKLFTISKRSSPSTGPAFLARGRAAAFTLVELLVVIAIIAVLAAILVPVLQRALLRAKQLKSVNNLHAIAVATSLYVTDSNNMYPLQCAAGYVAPFWTQGISKYLPPPIDGGWKDVNGNRIVNNSIFIDPLVPNGLHGASVLGDYGCNNRVFADPNGHFPGTTVSAAILQHPANLVTVMAAGVTRGAQEAGAYWVEGYLYVYGGVKTPFPSDRGLGNILCVFADGHTESIPKAKFITDKEKLLIPY